MGGGRETAKAIILAESRARVVVVFVCRKFANVLPLLNPPRLASALVFLQVHRGWENARIRFGDVNIESCLFILGQSVQFEFESGILATTAVYFILEALVLVRQTGNFATSSTKFCSNTG